jgi:hypothetical protein
MGRRRACILAALCSIAITLVDSARAGAGSLPTASGTQAGAGAVTGGMLPAIAYVSQHQTWGPVPAAPISVTLTGCNRTITAG